MITVTPRLSFLVFYCAAFKHFGAVCSTQHKIVNVPGRLWFKCSVLVIFIFSFALMIENNTESAAPLMQINKRRDYKLYNHTVGWFLNKPHAADEHFHFCRVS